MERVVTINLAGNSYQLEEPAYEALRAYMTRAENALASNPDKAEIVRDLEQAVADKCAGYLSPGKTVVSMSEMTKVLEEMGPVDGEEPAAAGADNGPRAEDFSGRPTRRLYRIKDGANVAGVCTGLAAYFDVDVTIVRILFIVATVFTSGFFAFVYIAMMFLVPSAHTSEEWAAAHGVPFNAQEVIDRAKREYERVASEGAKSWRSSQRAWRRQERQWRGNAAAAAPAPPVTPVGYVERMFAGLFAFVFSIVTAALLIAFLFGFFSLLGSGQVLGWSPPADVPLWLAVLILCVAYGAISAPFAGMRRASYATLSGSRGSGGGDEFVSFMIAVLVGVLLWLYVPDARLLMEQAYVTIRDFAQHWNANWD
jgi:phage shock protein PspC (stress-responsive transcriptional regulator)